MKIGSEAYCDSLFCGFVRFLEGKMLLKESFDRLRVYQSSLFTAISRKKDRMTELITAIFRKIESIGWLKEGKGWLLVIPLVLIE